MTPLEALLATLLPGDADYPPGHTVAHAIDPAAMAPLLALLPTSFAPGDEAALRALEHDHPRAFEPAIAEAYLAYYTDPAIRRVIERLTGYEARPPQPLGYDLPPFDESLLDQQKRRPPFWRDPGR